MSTSVSRMDFSLAGLLMMVSLAASLSVPGGYSLGAAIFVLTGLVRVVQRLVARRSLQEPALAGKLPSFFMAFAIIGALISFWHHEPSGHYELYIPFLWAPLIFVAVLESGIDRRYVWLGCLLGATLACIIAVYQFIHLGVERPSGFLNNPIFFGNNALLLGTITLAGRHDAPFNLRKPVWQTLAYMGFLFGVAASLTSQSKGGWPLVPVVLAWVLVEDLWRASGRQRLSLLVAALAMACLLPFVPLQKSLDRVSDAANGAMHWFKTGEITENSASPRLEIWKFGLSIWAEKPWLGHSREGVYKRLEEKMAVNEVNPQLAAMGIAALHNESLQFLAEKGLIGLSVWAAMFAASALVFWRACVQPEKVQRMLGKAGLIAVAGTFVFGLTDTNLIWNANRQIFVFLVMTMAALVLAERKKSGEV